jgi:hypothetical protein
MVSLASSSRPFETCAVRSGECSVVKPGPQIADFAWEARGTRGELVCLVDYRLLAEALSNCGGCAG